MSGPRGVPSVLRQRLQLIDQLKGEVGAFLHRCVIGAFDAKIGVSHFDMEASSLGVWRRWMMEMVAFTVKAGPVLVPHVAPSPVVTGRRRGSNVAPLAMIGRSGWRRRLRDRSSSEKHKRNTGGHEGFHGVLPYWFDSCMVRAHQDRNADGTERSPRPSASAYAAHALRTSSTAVISTCSGSRDRSSSSTAT